MNKYIEMCASPECERVKNYVSDELLQLMMTAYALPANISYSLSQMEAFLLKPSLFFESIAHDHVAL